MKWKRVLSLGLLSCGIGLLSLTGLDIVIYELQDEWRKALVVFVSWGFIGIGLTLIGLALLIQSKLESV